jgi:transposase-like protein
MRPNYQNQLPDDVPTTLLDFARRFSDERACAEYLIRVHWPEGFVCPTCGSRQGWLRHDRGAIECAGHHDTSLTAGTVMHRSRQPLTLWFYAAYLVSTLTPGVSALQFQKQLGIKRYETAFQMLHKLRAALVAPDRERLHGLVEVDDGYVGGEEPGRPGRGVKDKAVIIVAVEVRWWLDTSGKKAPGRHEGHHAEEHVEGEAGVTPDGKAGVWRRRAGRVRMSVLPDLKATTVQAWMDANVAPTWTDEADIERKTVIYTDGHSSYAHVNRHGYVHEIIAEHRDKAETGEWLPMVHLIISNLKRWLIGTHKGAVLPHHLQAYLNEFTFRFNRRFWRGPAFLRALGLTSRPLTAAERPEYATLYSGQYVHPNPFES